MGEFFLIFYPITIFCFFLDWFELVNIVQSLNIYPMNSSCVIMSWTLLPMDYVVTSFVIEWTNLNGEEQIKWITAPPNVRRYHIFGEFEYENICFCGVCCCCCYNNTYVGRKKLPGHEVKHRRIRNVVCILKTN